MSPKDIAPACPPAVRPGQHRRAALAVLTAASALALTACGEAPTGTLHTRAGFTATGEEIPVSVCPTEGEARLAGDEGLLIGAHFALRVECVASFSEIPADFQLDYLFGENQRLYTPEPGYEFTLVQFAPEPGAEAPYPDDTSEVSATLNIGDETWDFEGEAPAPGAVYFAVAEKDAPVTLEVVDAERAQTMDLRARTKEGLVQALYHGTTTEVTTDPAEASVDGYTTEGSYEYWFDDWKYSTQFIVTREVFQPGAGWVAEPDRALLGIEFGWLSSSSGLEWAIDPAKALKVTGPDGDLTPLTSDHTDEEWNGGVWRTFTLTYDVPADALAYTLNFHPEGPVSWPEEGIDLPITGDKNHEIAVSFE